MQDAVKGNLAVHAIIERRFSKSRIYIQKRLVGHMLSFRSVIRKRVVLQRMEFYKMLSF